MTQSTRDLLIARKKELEQEKAEMEAKCAPLVKERDALRAEMEPREKRLNALNNALRAITQPRKGRIELELASLNKALSDKVMRAVEADTGKMEVTS